MRVDVVIATWDDTFMAMAEATAKRSKDPRTQVGACIVGNDNRVLSVGYNGAPNGWHDDKFPWDDREQKRRYVIHAERNAILNFRGSLREFQGATCYVTLEPCIECAKELAQVGVTRIIYRDEHKLNERPFLLYCECGITMRSISEVRKIAANPDVCPF